MEALLERTILVIDSEEETRRLIVDTLRAMSELEEWKFLTAADGEDGWGTIQEREPSLVITSYSPLWVSGIKIAEWTKERFPGIKIIGMGMLQKAEADFQKAGADGFILKPTQTSQLCSLVRQLLELE